MAKWLIDDLESIDSVDELQIFTRREDGSLRKPVTIWAVHVDNDLFVRAVRGTPGLWYRHALETGEGAISAGGVEQDTIFEPETDPDLNNRIDEAFRKKYSHYSRSIVDSTLTKQAKEATLKVSPV